MPGQLRIRRQRLRNSVLTTGKKYKAQYLQYDFPHKANLIFQNKIPFNRWPNFASQFSKYGLSHRERYHG